MRVLQDGRVNPNPCTKQDEAANWQAVSNYINNTTALDEKVKVSGSDTVANYLSNKLTDTSSIDAAADATIFYQINAGPPETLTLYMDSDAILSYSASGTYALTIVDGILQWFDTTAFGGGGGSDDKTVKVNSSDPTSSYLHSAITDNAALSSGKDLTVASQSHASNETETFFVDVSTITNYHATEFRLLGTKINSQYFSITDILDNIFTAYVGIYYDSGTLGLDYTWIRGKAIQFIKNNDADFYIDEVETIGGGRDPRSDPMDPAEQVLVKNFCGQHYLEDGWVTAFYIAGHWYALPRETTLQYAAVYTTISAATGSDFADWGTGQVKIYMDDGSGVSVTPTDVVNHFSAAFPSNAEVIIDVSHDPPRVVAAAPGGQRAICKLTDACSAATGTPRSPGTTALYDVIKGSDPGSPLENWSLVELTDGSYVIVEDIGGDSVIVSAFC